MNRRFGKQLGGATLAVALAGGMVVATAGLAAAHTPDGGASCEAGVFAKGTNYEAKDSNVLKVSVDGASDSKSFNKNGNLSMAIPSDGVAHNYTWSVTTTNSDPSFSKSGSGSIKCGVAVPPKPDKVVTTTTKDGTPNCETKTVEVVTTTTTTDWVLKDNVWVKGEPVTTTNTSTRQATVEECPEVVVPPKPKKIVKRTTTESEPNCELNEVVITKTKTVTDWVYNEKKNKWVKGEPVVTTTTSTRPTTAEECGNGEIVKPDFSVPTKCRIIDPTNREDLPAYFFYFVSEDDEGTGPIIIGPGQHKEIAVDAEQVSYYVYYDSANKEDKGTVQVEQDCDNDGGTEPPPPADVPDEPKANEPPAKHDTTVVTTSKKLPSGAPHSGAVASSSDTMTNGAGAILALILAGITGFVATRRRTNKV